VGHLQFALRYEGVNLQLLSLLFERIDSAGLCEWITQSPTSAYARRVCFLYEWLTDNELPVKEPVPAKMRYVDALDADMQFATRAGAKDSRFRVNDNLPGPFSPQNQFPQRNGGQGPAQAHSGNPEAI
jgi:hypothetical protein